MEAFNKLKLMVGRRLQALAPVSCRTITLLFFALLIWRCGERQTSKEILVEFKQQPEEKYVYRIKDDVEWEIEDTNGRYAYQHQQEQKSEMTIAAIDSAMVRSLTMMFVITKDTLIDVPEFSWQKKRGSVVGRSFEYQLRMRKNGEIIDVSSQHPKVTFYFNRSYKPSQPVFPDRPILPGFAWTQNFQIDVPNGNPTVVTTQYEFKVLDDRLIIIDFKGVEFKSATTSDGKKPSRWWQKNKSHRPAPAKFTLRIAKGSWLEKSI
jgi:hypothetical protein